jgi:[ribosomal protein S5]-alanine N-acetyltransferase
MTTLPIWWYWPAIGKSRAGRVRYPTPTAKPMGAIACVQENHATGQPRRFAIALQETDRLIGGVGLDGSTGDGSDEPALGYWLGQPYWGNGYAREADRGRDRLRVPDPPPENDPRLYRPRQHGAAKVLLQCGLKNVGEIELLTPTHHGERRALLFRISRPAPRT